MPPPTTAISSDSASTSVSTCAVGEADGLQHAQLAGPLAHRLGHGVAGDEQDGEEDRGEDGRDDRADVAHLLGEALDERLLGLGLRLVRASSRTRASTRLRDRLGVLRILHADVVPADQSLSPRSAFSSK